MFRSRPFFRCAHVRAGSILDRRPWLVGACVQSFASPFASKASRHPDAITDFPVKLSASKVSRNHGKAGVSVSKVRRQSAHDTSDAKISVHNAGWQDFDVKALACSHHNDKSHFVDGDVKGACTSHANTQFSNGDVRVADSVACLKLASSSKFSDKWLPADVSNASCKTQFRHVSLQTSFKQTPKEAQKVLADLQQQKIELLESEQFSLFDARRILQTRVLKSFSVEQLATALQALKKSFPCIEVVHDIVVNSSNVLLQPAELVQQKLKLLHDFQVKEEVVRKLCGKGKVLSVSIESLQKRLMFYDDIGLTVAARNKMFSKGFLILLFSIENSIQPTLKFLESTGLTKESILKVAQHCPDVFYMSLDNLMKKYEYIRQLGFSVDEFPKVFRFATRLSIKNIEEHLHTLRVLGFTDDDVQTMIQRQPGILALSSENMKCKVDFLIGKQHRNLTEIVHFPTCLLYSLQARIIPRFNVINELGHSKVYSLSFILCRTDSRFINWFEEAIDSKNGLCAQLETCYVKT